MGEQTMATVPDETNDHSIGPAIERVISRPDELAAVGPWLVAVAALLGYGVVHVVLIGGAIFASVYLTVAVPGMAGFVVFVLVGLPLVVSARIAAHRLFIHGMNTVQSPTEFR